MPIEVKMWQARDGKTFPTEVEALRHELQKEVENILDRFRSYYEIDLEHAQTYFRTRPEKLKKVIQYFQFLAGNIPEPHCPKTNISTKENSNEPR